MTVQLRDGTRVLIRPIEPEDRTALAEGFQHLSPESRYRRFFAPVIGLSEGDLDYLTRVDHHAHEALVAVEETTGEGVGVARYVQTGPDVAEPAIVEGCDPPSRAARAHHQRATGPRTRAESRSTRTGAHRANPATAQTLRHRRAPTGTRSNRAALAACLCAERHISAATKP